MTKKKLEKLKSWFADYAASFKTGNPDVQKNILLKEFHTYRVCEEIKFLGGELELSNSDLRLAETIALLHDIGRFEQYTQYQTFVDRYSENHAELGVKIIRSMGVLKGFRKSNRDLIEGAVLYHNRRELPDDLKDRDLFFAKLLRDADKLDIFKVVIDNAAQRSSNQNAALDFGLPKASGISDAVYEDLKEGRIVDIEHLQNLNDFRLLVVGWIYDVNFEPTLRQIYKREYLPAIRNLLPAIKKIDTIFNVSMNFLEESIHLHKKVAEK